MGKGITPTFLVHGDNIEKINKKILELIIEQGNDFNFGDKTEIKQAREVHMTVHIYGKAIKDLINGKIPKSCNMGKLSIKAFQQSFLELNTNPTGYIYTYPQLLKEYPKSNHEGVISHNFHNFFSLEYQKEKHICIINENNTLNQMEISKIMLQEDIKENILSNRNVGTLYHPYMWDMKAKPCFLTFQVRYMGNNLVSLRILFRSHDYGDAVMPNLAGLSKVFNELIIKPNKCEISEIILTSWSAHGYEHSSQDIEKYTGIKWHKTNINKVQG